MNQHTAIAYMNVIAALIIATVTIYLETFPQ